MRDDKPLSDPDELLHRQVHPAFIRNGRVGSQAFKPTPKDEGKLSVSRGAIASAQQAFLLYTEELKLPSAGAWSVSVAECSRTVRGDLRTARDDLRMARDGSKSFRDDLRWAGVAGGVLGSGGRAAERVQVPPVVNTQHRVING